MGTLWGFIVFAIYYTFGGFFIFHQIHLLITFGGLLLIYMSKYFLKFFKKVIEGLKKVFFAEILEKKHFSVSHVLWVF